MGRDSIKMSALAETASHPKRMPDRVERGNSPCENCVMEDSREIGRAVVAVKRLARRAYIVATTGRDTPENCAPTGDPSVSKGRLIRCSMVKFVSCYYLAVRTLRPERPNNLTHPVIALRELNR
jgi:hypothetical protein